jgi:hypothetical protein
MNQSRPAFLVTIDTEGDNPWSAPLAAPAGKFRVASPLALAAKFGTAGVGA